MSHFQTNKVISGGKEATRSRPRLEKRNQQTLICLQVWQAVGFPQRLRTSGRVIGQPVKIKVRPTKIFLRCSWMSQSAESLHLYIKWVFHSDFRPGGRLQQQTRTPTLHLSNRVGVSLHPIHGPNNCFCRRLIRRLAQRWGHQTSELFRAPFLANVFMHLCTRPFGAAVSKPWCQRESMSVRECFCFQKT